MRILDTERLYLRQLTQDDFSALAAILQNPRVMYAYEGAFTNEEVQAWLDKQRLRYENDGFGLWAVRRKSDHMMIGQCGITWQDADGEQMLEVGYLFREDAWKQGYASEAAIACKQYAFDKLDANEVCSIIRDTNLASQRVAIRNGMLPRKRFVKHYRGMDMPHIVFVAKR